MTTLSRRDLGRLTISGFAIGVVQPSGQSSQASPASQASQASQAPQGQSTQPAAQPAARRRYRYIHVDVFTERPFEGNQLLVFLEPGDLDADRMLTLTRESNYSECTFVLPPDQPGVDHRVRIFTRNGETRFAGHPTLGTAFALAAAGALKPGTSRSVFGLGIGPTQIDLEWQGSQLAFAWMTQLKPTFGKTIADLNALAAALGVDAEVLRGQRAPAQEVNCGSTFLVVPAATRKAVDAAALDRAKADALFAAAGIERRGVYLFTTERGQDDATAYSRLLGSGGIEDPATGSAAGPAGCFMTKYGFVAPDRSGSIVILQGVLVKRPSRIQVKIGMSGSEIGSVKVGGRAVIVGDGTMSF